MAMKKYSNHLAKPASASIIIESTMKLAATNLMAK
jgi:hypothetical protein